MTKLAFLIALILVLAYLLKREKEIEPEFDETDWAGA